MDPGAQLPGPAGRQHRGVAEAVGQRLCLLHPPLCCQPLRTVKVEKWNLKFTLMFGQVQPAILFQLLANPRDELPAFLHLRVATPSLSGHQLPAIPGSCTGRVRPVSVRAVSQFGTAVQKIEQRRC